MWFKMGAASPPESVALWPWLGGSLGWRVFPYTKGLPVQFPGRAHIEVVGLVLSWGTYGRQLVNVSVSRLMFLSLSLSTPTHL